MTSVTLPRRAHNLQSIREHRNNHSCNTDDEDTNNKVGNNHRYFPRRSKLNKSTKAVSCDTPDLPPPSSSSSPTPNNNRLSHLCSRFKRRFIVTKETRTRSEDINENTSERRLIRYGNYESFSSSSVDDPANEFVWPDFERVYDSIPPCLINALPGLDDFSVDEKYNQLLNTLNPESDPTDEYSIEQTNLFAQCQRGKHFRRNAICNKLDRSQYNGQLDTFIQQLMVEKLMRTWT